jgi:KDO2-lipid IV(A) lauroyltransferase
MARKPRNPLLDYLVYLAVRGLVCAVQAMPPAWAFKLAAALARVAYRVDRRHREVAADNLRHAFPELAADPARLDRLVRATYAHFLRVVVEIVLLPRKLHVGCWRRYASMPAGRRLMGPLLSDRPLLLVTAHFGNWEIAGYMLGAIGFRTYAIARVLDNPHLERFLRRFRQATGQTIVAKTNDFERLTAALRAGGKVATLADQDAGPRGVFVDFFGRPASAHKAVALMALEFDAVMAVIGVPRVGEPMHYAVTCEDVIDPREYAERPDAVRAITQRYHAALERLIRRHPEQYFWLHRRWKTRPAARQATGRAGGPTPPGETKAA